MNIRTREFFNKRMISHKFSSPVLAFVTILCFICNSAYRSLLDQETIFIRAPARPLFAGCFFSLLSIVSQNNSDTYSSLGIFYSFIFSLSLFLLHTLIFIFFSLLFSIFCGWNIVSVFFFLFRRCWIRLCTCNLCINKTPFNIVRSLHRFIAI